MRCRILFSIVNDEIRTESNLDVGGMGWIDRTKKVTNRKEEGERKRGNGRDGLVVRRLANGRSKAE